MSKIDNISARFVLTVTIGLLFVPFFVVFSVFSDVYSENEFFIDQLIFLMSYLTILLILLFKVRKQGIFLGLWPGSLPGRRTTGYYLSLSLPMIGLAVLCTTLVYWPISFVAPNFVQSWLLEDIATIVFKSDWKSVLGSVLGVLCTVLIAPIAEEVVFRWLLIERWRSKYSTPIAISLSSIIFAILHADLLGAFLFGILLSLVYLHTGSLWGPILIHVGNNAFAVLISVIDEFWPHTPQTVAEFQTDWVLPMVGFLLILPWVPVAIKRRHLALSLFSTSVSGKDDMTPSGWMHE